MDTRETTAPESSAAPKLEGELRRGALVLAVLSQLREVQYGYSLRQALAQRGTSQNNSKLKGSHRPGMTSAMK